MHRTRIKICGITRREDAVAAAQLGADAVGLICYTKAARYISADRARQIVASLPPFVTPVAVFADSTAQQILDTAREIGLTTVQLNGQEDPALIGELKHLKVLKAIRVDRATIEQELMTWRSAELTALAGIIVEPAHTGEAGGTGVENDWATVLDQIQNDRFGRLPLIAAGGLTPTNVADVVRKLNPWAVDVSSGVEESKGIKSIEKMRDFIAAVRSVH